MAIPTSQKIKHSRSYYDQRYFVLADPPKRISSNRGGTRSGKTYGITQFLIETAIRTEEQKLQPQVFSFVRKTFPALRASSYRDFKTQLKLIGLYDLGDHDRSNHEYRLFGNLFEFFSVDQYDKVQSRSRDHLFVNEVLEITYDDFMQLALRTNGKIFADYNPRVLQHWYYDQVESRQDCQVFVTTYKDNPYLVGTLRSEIERLKDADPTLWSIYGLGEKAAAKDLIFSYDIKKNIPEGASLRATGLDFGFANSYTALCEVWQHQGELYLVERLYEVGLTAKDINQRFLDIGLDRQQLVYADPEDPRLIKELQNYGWHIVKAKKPKDSVRYGIDLLRQHPLHVIDGSTNLVKELNSYKWKITREGIVTNEPVKAFDHLIDAARMAVFMTANQYGTYYIH